jgi:hypothetical protein
LAHLDDAGLAAFCEAERLVADPAGVYVRVAAHHARSDKLIERTPWEGPLRAGGAAAQSDEPTRAISRVMTRAARGANGANLGVNEDTILQLDVRARSLPDVNLLDLPGVVGGSVDGEPDDMAERTKRLVERHLGAPDTLVLVVVEATAASVRNSLAFSLVKNAGKVEKAVGVLTKADGCIGPSLTRLKARLEGSAKDVPLLGYGYLAVVNRDSCDGRNLSIAAAAAEEAAWLARNLPAELCDSNGGDALVARLAAMLTSYVRDTWAARALALLRGARKQRRAALAELGAEVASNAAARAETLRAVLAPLPDCIASVGAPHNWHPFADALRSSVGSLATLQQELADVRAKAIATPNAVKAVAYRTMALCSLERRALAAADALLCTQRAGGAEEWPEGSLLRKLRQLMHASSGELPLRPLRFVYLFDAVLALMGTFLQAQRPALQARIRVLLCTFADALLPPWDGTVGGSSSGALTGCDAHIGRVSDALWRALNVEMLNLLSRAWLADGGVLHSADALYGALLARPENGLAALLAEDAATAAARAALKRAATDLRTAIVAIAGLHHPPRLLEEDGEEAEAEVPVSSGGTGAGA